MKLPYGYVFAQNIAQKSLSRKSERVNTAVFLLWKGYDILPSKSRKRFLNVIADFTDRPRPEINFGFRDGQSIQLDDIRIMSRMEARRTLDLEVYRRAMEGIYATSVNEHTLDEAPMVYKSLEEILETAGETVDMIDVMKPIYNFKSHGWHGTSAAEKEDPND